MFRWEGKELRKQVRKVKISFHKHCVIHMVSQEYDYSKLLSEQPCELLLNTLTATQL